METLSESACYQRGNRGVHSRNFGDIASGDLFQLEGRLYRKRGKYSALLLRSASGLVPMMAINRMIHPDSVVTITDESTPPFCIGSVKSPRKPEIALEA